MRVLIPAYITSELKASFQIGTVLFLPFMVIDVVIASITVSMGMMQLPLARHDARIRCPTRPRLHVHDVLAKCAISNRRLCDRHLHEPPPDRHIDSRQRLQHRSPLAVFLVVAAISLPWVLEKAMGYPAGILGNLSRYAQ